MTDNSDSNDKSSQSLDFIIEALEEHEHKLDESIDNLTACLEQTKEATGALTEKIDKIDEKINRMRQEISNVLATNQMNQKTNHSP